MVQKTAVNRNINQEIKKIFEKFEKKFSIQCSQKTVKDAYSEIIARLSSEDDEREFLKQISSTCSIPFLEEHEALELIDYSKIEQYGLMRFIEKSCLPLKDGAVLTYNPFLDYYGSVYLTLRKNILKIYDELKQRYSSIKLHAEEIDAEKYFYDLVQEAYTKGVSDIHIEFDPLRQVSQVRFRKDGLLYKARELGSLQIHELLINKIFELSGINTNDFLRLHDKKIQIEILKKQIPIRVSAVPVNVAGERKTSSVVLRILAGHVNITDDFLSLGYLPEHLPELKKIISLPYGLVVICGPTGSGKTTLLYAMLTTKSRELVKIITIEDPVEVSLGGNIVQVEIRETKEGKDDITFSSAIRTFLRQDPDVMLIGEIRDSETATEAVRAAITGHLVFATLHANTSVGAFTRLLDLGVSPYLLADCIRYIVAQRLVRKLCDKCKILINTSNPSHIETYFNMELEDFEYNYKNFINKEIYVANKRGCQYCSNGYSGRTVIYEILKVEENILTALLENKAITYKEAFINQEANSFASVAMKKIVNGETTIQEVERYIYLT